MMVKSNNMMAKLINFIGSITILKASRCVWSYDPIAMQLTHDMAIVVGWSYMLFYFGEETIYFYLNIQKLASNTEEEKVPK